MPSLSLTDFVDVISRSGTPKATKVREIKNRPPYSPTTDYYKHFRDGIVGIHRKNQPRATVKLLSNQADAKKLANYTRLVSGYQRWWGRKSLVWLEPQSGLWGANGIDIRVNPELGLELNGIPYLIKLYLKSTPLTKARIDIVTHLMHVALSPSLPNKTVLAVLDVGNGKLFTPSLPIPTLTATLHAELAYIASLWPQV
jgi:hypothetical protein